MSSQIKNKWYYILNVYRLIRSEVKEALRTIHELIKSTIIQVVLLLKSHVCFATLHTNYLVISVCIYDYCI
jgi:phosphatidylinositol kinase/protein kinase (PI-3  family)